jgi:hypothetical protein
MDIKLLTKALEIAACLEKTGCTSTPAIPTATQEQAVLVTTDKRGVFFGYATDTSGDVINLRRARNCIYWPAGTKGFLGLCSMGPQKGSRVGPPANIQLRGITCVAEVEPAAVVVWEQAPWDR